MKLGVVMDPLSTVNTKKDSTFAMILEAQRRGWTVYMMTVQDLYVEAAHAGAWVKELRVQDKPTHWHEVIAEFSMPLTDLDIILMRKDPPVDQDYMYATQILELALKDGVRVVNHPQALRDANEKLFTAWFPECCAPTLVSTNREQLHAFADGQDEVVLKPLNGMGGRSVFRVRAGDPNFNVVIETLSLQGQRLIMAQRYIPEITEGDKRILLVGGEPIPYALARIPAKGEFRGNLAMGAVGKVVALTDRDRWICTQIAPTLQKLGLVFVGIDVIGDYLTEINVTSPTCIRELDAACDLNISAQLLDVVSAS